MAQIRTGTGFRYPSDIHVVLEPWREKLGEPEFSQVVALLEDRDRAFETYSDSWAPVFDQVLTEGFTDSVSFVALDGPSLTARLPRGSARVNAGGTLQATVAASTLQIALFVDSLQFQNTVAVLNIPNNSGSQGDPVWVTGGTTYLIEGLSPGDHTFELRYRSVTGTGANFSNRFLEVTPVV